MQKSVLIICLIFNLITSICFAEQNLIKFEINYGNYTFEEFCSKYINDKAIEIILKNELNKDYVLVSLDECLDIALKNNFNISIKEHDYKSVKYEYRYALSKFMPIFSTQSYIADYSGQILVGGVLRDVIHETAVSVNMKVEHYLFEGGKQIFDAKAKKYFAKATLHNSNFTVSQTLYAVSIAYYDMLLAKNSVDIYLKNLIERNVQLSLSKKIEKSGLGGEFDIIRSKYESADAKLKLITALKTFTASQVRLSNLLGINIKTSLMPFEEEISKIILFEKIENVDKYFDLANLKREDLKNLDDFIKYQKHLKNSELTEFFPKPLISYQQQFQGTIDTSVKPNYVLSAVVNWIPGENTILGTLSKIKSRNEKINSYKLERENQFRNIKEYILTSLFYIDFNNNILEISKRKLEYSKSAINLALARFNKGKGILLELIETQSDVTDARIEYIGAIHQFNVAQLDLAFGTGIISKELIFQNYKP